TAALSMTGNGILIAAGNSKTASLAMIFGMVINIILDPLFIFGWGPFPGRGIQGAAIATVISQFLSAFFILTLLYRKYRLLSFERVSRQVVKRAWKRIIVFGIPATLGMLMVPLGSGVLTRITAEFGDAAVAASAAAARIEMAAFVVPMSLGMSLIPFIGQNYGARRYDRIQEGRSFAMRFALFFLVGAAVIIAIFCRPIVAFFAVDPAVRHIMTVYLLIVPWGLWGVEIHRFAGFAYTGCGRPAVAAWLNALRIVGFLIPFSLTALYFKSLPGLFTARLAADVFAALIAFFMAAAMTRKLAAGRVNQ
ncbi:MAG: MATE family efflux transporter, partial [Victivallales bacterium]|nr:MATE family efflux transporter [Victivallales bacterium]